VALPACCFALNAAASVAAAATAAAAPDIEQCGVQVKGSSN
jgi:hypothetical protein